MSEYKISIIMPVYNSEKCLKSSLDSIVNQSIGVENLEVIIVNDASTGGTADIIDDYAHRYSNFKVVHLTETLEQPICPITLRLICPFRYVVI